MSVRRIKRQLKSGRLHERWIVDIGFRQPDGSLLRIRRVPRVQTRVGAQRQERQLLLQLEQGSEGLAIAQDAVKPTTPVRNDGKLILLREFWPDFFATYVVPNIRPSEQHAKSSIWEIHLRPAFGHLSLDQVGSRNIEQYKAEKLLSGRNLYSAKSINNHLAVLRTALRMAQRWGLVQQVPYYRDLKLPELQTRFLSREEAGRLAKAPTGQWRAMIVLALNTGLRIGELIALKWADIDLRLNRVIVRRSDWKGILGLPKSGKSREIGLNAAATEAMKALDSHPAEWVFTQANGKRLTHAMCRRPLHQACDVANLKRFQWHTLRHTFASHLVARGVPLRGVQLLLGPANHSTTERYAHFSPDVSRRIVSCLDDHDD